MSSSSPTAKHVPTIERDLREVLILQLVESKSNPRKCFDGLDELANSIKVHGVLEPILVRPVKGKERLWEVIVGARRVRASKLAKFDSIPAIVHLMTDRQVLETQLTENSKRCDLDPIEEAQAFAEMIETHKATADEVAAIMGISRSAVYNRLKLRNLCAQGAEALRQGRLSASVAEIVARIPIPKLQEEAVHNFQASDSAEDEMGAMPFRAAQREIQRRYMLSLTEAPWNLKDETVLAKGSKHYTGSCENCLKRTGANRDLFFDIKNANVCTDPECYAAKRKAHGDQAITAATKAGQAVLPKAETKKLFLEDRPDVLMHDAAYVDVTESCRADAQGRSYEKLLGKDTAKHAIVAQNPKTGAVHQLLAKKGLPAVLKAKGHNFKSTAAEPTRKRDAGQLRSGKVYEATEREVLSAIVAAAEKGPAIAPPLMQWMASALLTIQHSMVPEIVWERRGFGTQQTLEKWLAGEASSQQMRALCIELLYTEAKRTLFDPGDIKEWRQLTCRLCNVDPKAIESQVALYLKSLADAKKGGKKAPAKKKAGTKKKRVKK